MTTMQKTLDSISLGTYVPLLFFAAAVGVVLAVCLRKEKRVIKASGILFGDAVLAILALVFAALALLFSSDVQNPAYQLFAILAILAIYAAEYAYVHYAAASVELFRRHAMPRIWAVVTAIPFLFSAGTRILSLFLPEMYIPIDPTSYSVTRFWVSHVGEVFLAFLLFGILLQKYKALTAQKILLLSAPPFFLAVATLLGPAIRNPILRYPALLLSLIIVYTQYHVDLEEHVRNENVHDMETRLTLVGGRLKPHFINNILTTIYYLTESDPEAAQETVSSLSEYLTDTLTTIDEKGMVPFSRELELIRHYLSLEKLRFEDRLRVKYDIDVEEFRIPPMTIQILVENAVKHGVAYLDRPGTVYVETRRLAEGRVRIRVTDDGPGIERASAQEAEEVRELLTLVEYRLHREVEGNLTIESVEGKGVTATVTMLAENNRSDSAIPVAFENDTD